jgi:hypothetical protein
MRRLAMAIAAAILPAASAQQSDSVEVEPPILPGNLVPDETPAPDVAQLARKLNRARENATGARRLVKMGALAQVEAESRELRVIRLEAELALAQFAVVKTQFADRATVDKAKQAAAIAAANLKKAELDAAARNLERQRKLLALGSGGKNAVRRAEEKLTQLKAESEKTSP